MNAVGNQDYALPIRYREGCKRIGIFSLVSSDSAASATATHFKLSIKLSLVSEHYNFELIENSLEILQRSNDDLSDYDQQRLFNLLINYLCKIQEQQSLYFYMAYASLGSIFTGWVIMAAIPNLSIILGGALLSILLIIGVEMLIAISIGILVGYFLYKNINHKVQLQLENKLLDAFIIYKDYLDTIDSFIQPTTTQANKQVTQFFTLQNRRRICSAENAEQINFINPLVSAHPA